MGPLKKTASTASTVGILTPPPAGGTGGPLEIVFTFDTTGSMYSCLREVRKKLDDIIQRLFSDIPNLRIAVFAHGDYGDTYVTKFVDFTNDVSKLCEFVKDVEVTGGSDWEECYELVLKQTCDMLSWSPGTQRAVVMIGDAVPHPVGSSRNEGNIDWKDEAERLRDQIGARVYAVQAKACAKANSFWEGLAKLTFGKHLNLDKFDAIVEMMMAICYREHGPEFFEAYEREVRAKEGAAIRREVDHMFNTLRDPTSTSSSTAAARKTAAGVIHKRSPTKHVVTTKRGTITKRPKITGGKVEKKTKTSAISRKIYKRACKKAVMAADDSHTKYSIDRQFRETVGARSFDFKEFAWTPWQVALSDHVGKMWRPRRDRAYSVRHFRKGTKMGDVDTPAVYEFAVQPKDEKMYPVYMKSTLGGSAGRSWYGKTLRNYHIRQRMSNVVKEGGKVYVRKSCIDKPVSCNGQVIDSVTELNRLIANTYNYAWNGRTRSITKKM